MKKISLLLFACTLLSLASAAHAQQLDVAFGVTTTLAPASKVDSQGFFLQSLRGGAYPAFSGDVLFYKGQIGVNGEVAWRGSQALYGGDPSQPYRPIFYDFNGIWSKRFSRIAPEVMAGIGAESIRIYQNFVNCTFTGCTNYVTSNHFMGHFGGGIKFYVFGNFFVRPEAHLYMVHNNAEFSSGRAGRVGISIGYTLGGPGPKY